MSSRCGFCDKPAEKAPFGRLFPWAGGEWRCVRCLRCEEEDAWRERRRQQGEEPFPRERCPWSNEWLASPELYHLLRERAVSREAHRGPLLGGDLFLHYPYPGDIGVQAWVSPGGIIVAYWSARWPQPPEGEAQVWEGWIEHLLDSEPLEIGWVRDGSSYGALGPPHATALPILKWGQTGDWMGLAGRSWHGADH
jgi:hypothetical protein